ncbi:gliding motility-associated-like protein [Flavobacterium nitrogenifigens]|uniref:Gliding motility-associated-like protein n=2 Tax=Flavobacterium TaxID=237 RepID=A0A7W7ITF1_9FLAO|nr:MULTISPECIES: gliding motility-associated C-terminal domain-containing protein [Flavobacterium]MBB4800211.1 gliding motility-associated-like protein [Flavobacterium nitrogenifigens]MBB6386039.1 gliding motility-associated-like protein [Flavobacterium notoginsengisoli]
MRNFTFKRFNLFKLFFVISLFFITAQTRAQFPYSQSFKNSTAPGVLFGGEPVAFLTGGAGLRDGYNDANGSGYLRLTNRQGSQKGIVYSDMYSFPSAYGMTITFEYYTHSGNGADGIAFILFDATASPVAVGAFGGSLGYAQRNSETGFSKGYLGIGIDEYGNFSANNEGKSGGAPGGVMPSNVTLRGAGTGTSGYPHLISVKTTDLASSFNVAGGDRNATDNSKSGFRKMEVVLKPRSGGGFFIDVYLTHGTVRELIINNYEYKTEAPSNLKFAISSSTGGSNNFHEIRNLNITVDKSTLLTPVANADTFTGCIGLAATSGDITANDNGSVNTLGTINKSTVDLDPAVAGIQTSKTVADKGTFTYNSSTGAVTFTPLNNTVVGPVQINYTFNDTYDKTSNSSTITYNTYTAIANNTITAPSTSSFCTAPNDPGVITGSTATGGSTSSGGASTLTYQWEVSTNNIDFSPISGATAVSYDPPSTSTTAYYRRVVSSATCKDVSNVVSIVFGQASTPTATAATAITCNSFTANWNAVANATSYGLSVSSSSTFNTHVGNFDGRNLGSSSTSVDVTGLTSGQTYYFKVWSYNSCGVGPTASNVITVTVGNGSVAGTVSSAQTICSGTSPQDLTLTGYTGTIQWQSSTNNSLFTDINGATNATLTSAQMGALTANTYYRAVVKSGSCTAANSTSVLITISPVPSLGTISQFATTCEGAPARINLKGLLPNTTSTIAYSIDGVAQPSVSGVTSDASGDGFFETVVLTAANNGKTLRVTTVTTTSATPSCTSTVNKDVTLSINAASVGGTIASVAAICSGTSPANLVLSGNNGSVLRWQKSTDSGFSTRTDINVASTTLTSANIGNLTANTYFRAIVQNGDCSAVFSDAVLVTVNALPAVLTLTGSTICVSPGGNGTITSSTSANGINYQLYNSSNLAVQSAKSGNGSALTWTNLVAGNGYYVIGRNATTTCSSTSATVNVATNPNPDALVLTGSTICVSPGGNGTITSSTSANGINYQLYNSSNVAVQSAKSGNGSALTWTNLAAGTNYYVIGTNATTTCSSTSNTANVATTLNPTALALTGSVICVSPGGNGSISSSTSVNNVNYQLFDSNDVAIQSAKSGNGSALTWTNLNAGNGYYVIATNAANCTVKSNVVNITTNPNPTISIGGTLTACLTTTLTTTTNASSPSYVWYKNNVVISGQTSSSLVVNSDGDYKVKVTNTSTGCEATSAASTVKVSDTEKPAKPVLADITAECSATVTAPTTTDNCTGTVTGTTSDPLTYSAQGNYTINWSFNDGNGNIETATQKVIIKDTQKPSITCPATVVVSADANSCTATGVTLGTPVTSDNCSGTVTVTNNAPSSFPIGNTTVTWIATDAAGNTQTCTQTVTVNDTQKPSIICPATVVVSTDANSCTATGVTLGTPVTSDNCSGVVTVTNNAPSSFPIGNTTVTWTATDAAGNTQTCTQTVKVVGPIIANKDAVSINGYEGGTAVSNVLANDSLNCNAVVRNEVILSLDSTLPSVLTFDTATGEVKVKPNTPVGTYSFDYKICEVANTSNCNSATVEVKVTAPVILAVKENLGPINGSIGGTTSSLIASDKLNGVQAVIGTAPGEVTLTGTAPAGLTVNSDGTVTVGKGVKEGSYDVEYTICDNVNAGNCSTVTSTVTVTAAVLVANLDNAGSVVGGNAPQTLINVFDNDTKNAVKLDPSEVKLTPGTDPKGYVTIDASGNAILASNAPAGNYEVTYEICELLNPGNCSTNKVQVTVTAPAILAVKENLGPINGSIGGTTSSLITSDKLNGVQAVIGTAPGEVTLTGTAPAGLTVNSDGTVTVGKDVKEGSYDVEYTICDNVNAGNCSTVTSTVTVTAAVLAANLDNAGSVVGGNAPQTLINVFDNDTKNAVKLDPSEVKLTPGTDPKGYVTIDASGNAILASNAPAGYYEVTYEICELLNPGNCSTNKVQVTVTAPVILAVKENLGPINGSIGGTTSSLIASDKLNGVQAVIGTAPGEVTLTGTAPAGLTVNSDGTVTVGKGVKEGSYDVEYTICDNVNAGNCSTVTSTVTVTAAVLAANLDNAGSVVGANAPQTLINVFDNDTKNAVKLDPSEVKLTPGTDPKGYVTIDASGNAILAPNAPAGNYEVTYEICELLNPGNCSTNKVQVTVTAPVIDAVVDTITPINGNIGGTTIALTANDKLNGNPVVVGTAPGEVTFNIVGTLPAGLTLNPDNTITVAPNTPAGNYNVEYRICENTNPLNCDSVTIVVPVTAANLVANADSVPSVVSTNAPQTLINVFANDTKNGNALVPSDVNLTVTAADPKGYLTVDANGNAILAPNAPAGDYEVTYEICEKLNIGNCSSNTVKVTVDLPIIDAVVETLTPSINGSIGGTTANSVIDNDTLNGNPVVIGTLDGQVKLTAVNVPVGLTLNADGTITVAANTPSGIYNIEYSICEITNPSNCDTAISKVAVNNGTLVANSDVLPSVKPSNAPQTLTGSVFDNDTKNGQPLNSSDVTLTTSTPDPKGYLVLNPDGTVTLGANAPIGDYELTYTICEKLNPGNCSSNTVRVTVDAFIINAIAETLSPSINGSVGGTTTNSVIDNDTLNGNPVVIGTVSGQVKLTAVNIPSGLTLNADGTVTVAANTPSGIYNIEYSICEIDNPSNCDTAISKVAVNNGTLVANTDFIPSIIASNAPQTLINVFANDTKNGNALVPSDVNLTVTTADPKGYLTVDANGNAILAANAPAGDYELTYTICEKLNPSNCSSNTVRVIVDMPIIDAVEDTITPINGNIGGTTISLITNDKLNGNPVVVGTAPGEVTFNIVGTLPAGLVLNPDYTISVAPNTPAGNYNVEYSICENTNPSNCDSVTIVVPVTGGNLVANQDIVPSAVGVNVSQTLINVFANDTKDGNALVPSDVNLTVTTADPKGYLTVDANGNAILAPNAPAGDYELTYTICEKLNPSNCNSNIVKVTVTEPKMTVTANSYCSNNVPYVNYTVTPDNFTTNNKLTVKWIDSSNNVVATQSNLDLSGNLIWPGAVVDGNGNGVDWPGWVLNNGQWILGTDGFEGTRNGVKMEFSLNPTVTVSVAYPAATSGCNPNPTFTIQANNDVAGPIDAKKGTDTGINVLDNDKLNGVKPTSSNVVLATIVANPNLVLNADGSVSVVANTPNGIYELTYSICEKANTSNCSQAVVKVTVLNSVDPAPPTSNAITLVDDNNVTADGINGALEFVNVLDNDLINGQPINPADVTIKPLGNNTYFEWNADGTVNVKPNTPGGNYSITYQVCEKANAANCSTAILNVFVEVPAIAIIKKAEFNDENNSGFANAGETITYTFTVTNTGNVPLKNVIVKDPLTGVVVSGQAITLEVGEANSSNFSAVYKITQEDINLTKVTNQATAQGSSDKGIVVEDLSDHSSNTADNPTVVELDGCAIKVFKAFSPNGDDKNTRFYIRGIECYPNNTVEIYNRWGVLVFSVDGYNNNDRVFVGYSNGRSTIKQTDGLPVGTYFYILKYEDNAKAPHQESGYLYINK